MKRHFKIAFLAILVASFVTGAFAIDRTEYDDSYWIKSYYARLGGGVVFTNGDLNEKAISIKDTAGTKMKVYPPDISFMGVPQFTLGANARAISVEVSFMFSSFSESLTANPDEDQTNVFFWNVGFDFTYNFFWPEDFQLGVGLGYSYNSLKASNATSLNYEQYRVSLIGSGVEFILNARYYFNEFLAVVPMIKVNESWYKNLHTSPSELVDLDPYLWQTSVLASVALQFQF